MAEAETNRTETAAVYAALDREEAHLDEVGGIVEDITAWIAEANETPLTDLGFDSLQHRHETLASHRDRCDELAHQRQEFRKQTTKDGLDAGIGHKRLIRYLYEALTVDHPVLATVVRLEEICKECQRTVRSHLVRRA